MKFATHSCSIRSLAIVLAFLSLAACGQTGPLYLPGNPSQVEVPTDGGREASLPVPEDDAEDTDDNDEQGY